MQPQNETPNQSPMSPSPALDTPQPPSVPRKKSHKKLFIIVGVIILLIFVVPYILGLILRQQNSGRLNPSDPTAKLFYDSLVNAAQQTKVHFAHYEVTYQSQADKDAGKIRLYDKSLAEFDTKSKLYNTAYVSGDSIFPGNGRCVQNKEYLATFQTYKDFAAAEAGLKSPFHAASAPSDDKSGPCAYKGVYRPGKLSDGIIPIGFTAAQADSWANYLKANSVFVLTDGGSATHNGQSGHKINFTLGKRDSGDQITTDSLFYAQRDGDAGKTGGNNSDTTLFDRILDQENGTGLKGYYIFDETKKLPIYSEFTAVAVPGVSPFLPLETKQHYSYPDKFTIDATTLLEDL